LSADREEILSEIRRLIEEQAERLQGKLSPKEAIEYVQRKKLIAELLERLSSVRSKAD